MDRVHFIDGPKYDYVDLDVGFMLTGKSSAYGVDTVLLHVVPEDPYPNAAWRVLKASTALGYHCVVLVSE